MTDHIPADFADKVRKLAARFRQQIEPHVSVAECEVWECAAEAVEALLPTRPTLADMTDEERFNAVGTWADVDGFHPYRAVIGGVPAPKVPVFKPTTGSLDWVHPEDVTPLPELGRAWSPGGNPTGTPAPALPDGWRLAEHKDNGRVIVTTPNDDGRVYYVLPSNLDGLGFDWFFCDHSELAFLDTEP